MADVQSEPLEISAGERKDLLDLVEEKGRDRAHRKLPKGDVPKILLPYQQRWHQDTAAVRLSVKPRRIGFSWGCIAAEGSLEAARTNGMSQYYMGYNLGMAAENIGDALAFAEIYGLAASAISVHREREVLGESRQEITRFKLTFKSGHVYEALSSAPWNWRGRQGHARIDEAAFHRNLQEVIKGALAFRLWGGRVDVISTHNGEENEFNLLVREIKAGKLPWSLHEIDFDRALAEGLYKRICLVTGQTWSPAAEAKFREEAFADYPDQADANEELLCIPKKGSGAYIPRILLEQCHDATIPPPIRLTKPAEYVTDPNRIDETRRWLVDVVKPVLDNLPGLRTVYGQDFGRDADLSDVWVLQNDGPGHWRQVLSLELRRLPFDVQVVIRDFVLDNVPLLSAAKFDARGNGQSHAEGAMQKYGALVECVKATPEWYATWFPKYKAAYEDRSLSIHANEDVIADHRRVVLRNGRPTMDDGRDKGSDGQYRHGDSAIGGVLAWAATQADGQPPAGESVESEREAYEPEAGRDRPRVGMFQREARRPLYRR